MSVSAMPLGFVNNRSIPSCIALGSGAKRSARRLDDITIKGDGLNELIWTSGTKGTGVTTSVKGNVLDLFIPSSGATTCCSRVTSRMPVPTEGVLQISSLFVPPVLYASAAARPYIAIVQVPTTRDATYTFPYSYPTLKIGNSAVATLNMLYGGIPNNTFVVPGGSSVSTMYAGTAYAIIMTIDWGANTMSTSVDGVTILDAISFTYTANAKAAPHYLELGNADYVTSNGHCYFSNLVVKHYV